MTRDLVTWLTARATCLWAGKLPLPAARPLPLTVHAYQLHYLSSRLTDRIYYLLMAPQRVALRRGLVWMQ
jgi:hypothetical protein